MPFLAPVIVGIAQIGFANWAALTLGPALLRLGGVILINAATSAAFGRSQTASMSSSRTVTVREPIRPRDIVYGRARKGGTLIDARTTGPTDGYDQKKTGWLHLVVALSVGPVQSIGAIYFDGVLAINAEGVAQDRWTNRVEVFKRLGTEDQTAYPELIAAAGGDWTMDHRLRGVVSIYLRLKFDVDAYPGGIPNITADIVGKNDILDPRTGLRGYTENPALCVADYISLKNYGLNAAIGRDDGITSADLVEAANICDEQVALKSGGSEPRYSLNGIVILSDTPKAILEAMLSAMAGRVLNPDGAWRIRAGAYRIPTTTLTADEARGAMKLTTRVSRSDNFNAVRGKFVSPENDWQPDDFPAITSATYQAEDQGEQIWDDITLPFTLSTSMAQRLATIHLNKRRQQMRIDFAGKLSTWRTTIGDVVTLSYDRWGMAAKPFEVANLMLAFDGPALVPDLTLNETSPLVYDWSATQEQIYAAAPRSTLPSMFDVPTPTAPVAVEELYATREGAGVKTKVLLSWQVSDGDMVQSYDIQGARDGGAWGALGKSNDTDFEFLDAKPGNWKFRVRAVSYTGVRSAWAEGPAVIYGLTALPSAITGISLQSSGGLTVLRWDQHPDLDVRIGGSIVIRHSAAEPPIWSSSVALDRVQGGTAMAIVAMKPGSYLLAAEDSGKRQGPATAIDTDAAEALTFSTIAELDDSGVFAGTKTGVVVTNSTLRLQSGLITGTYQFASTIDLGSVRWLRLRSVIKHISIELGDLYFSRPGLWSIWRPFYGIEGAETDVIIQISSTKDNPALITAVWSNWRRVDSHEVSARGIRARAVLTSSGTAYTPSVSQLKLKAEAL